jgi:hypothetical protein
VCKACRLALVVLLCGASAAANAQSESGTGHVSLQFSFASHDVWRGFLDGGRTGEMDLGYSRGAWEFCTTTNLELAPLGQQRAVEVDFTATRRWKLPRGWSLGAGYDFYAPLRTGEPHGHEFWSGIEHVGRINFALKAYQFAVPHTGNYFSAEIGRTLLTRRRYGIAGGATLGYNRHMNLDHAGLSDATITLSVPAKVRRGTISPFAAYSKALTKDLDDHVIFGLEYAIGSAE